MARYSEIDWVSADEYNRTSDHHDGLTAWSGQKPRTANVTTSAGQMLTHVTKTVAHFNSVVTKWSEFAGCYGGADRETVLTALHTTAREIEALNAAAKLFHDAVVTYDDSVQSALTGKGDYDSWAADWTPRAREIGFESGLQGGAQDPDRVWPDGQTTAEKQVAIRNERQWNEPTALGINNDIADARSTLTTSIEGIDLADLAELRFTVHTAGLDSMDSAEEIQLALLNNDLFGDQLTVEEAMRIAEQVDVDSLPYTFIDPNGVKWVRLDTGEMVVVGSAMDPNLQAEILRRMAEDPGTRDIEINLGTAPETLGTVGEYGLTAGQEVVVSLADLLDSGGMTGGGLVLKSAGLALMLTTVGLSAGGDGQEYAYTMGSSHLLLTTDQKNEIHAWAADRNVVITGVSTVSGVVAATAVAVFVPGAGWMLTTGTSTVTGEVVSAFMDSQWDNAQSEREMLNSTHDGLPDEFSQAEYEAYITERLEDEAEAAEGTDGGGAGSATRPGE